jgi:hypothetical protein
VSLVGRLLEMCGYALVPIAPPIEEHQGCQHPDDRRVDVSGLNDRDHWICGVCRFDNKQGVEHGETSL